MKFWLIFLEQLKRVTDLSDIIDRLYRHNTRVFFLFLTFVSPRDFGGFSFQLSSSSINPDNF